MSCQDVFETFQRGFWDEVTGLLARTCMDSRWDSILSGSLTLSFVCEHRSVAYCLICCGYNLGLEIAMVTLLCLLLSATKALFLNILLDRFPLSQIQHFQVFHCVRYSMKMWILRGKEVFMLQID